MSRLLRARPKLSFKKRSYPTRFKKFFDDLKTYPSTPLPHSLPIAVARPDSVSIYRDEKNSYEQNIIILK